MRTHQRSATPQVAGELKNVMENKNMKKGFRLKRGQVDYSRARWAPVVNCVLKYKNKILIVERSKKLRFYPGYWNGVSGFIDDQRSLNEKVIDELKEEVGIS